MNIAHTLEIKQPVGPVHENFQMLGLLEKNFVTYYKHVQRLKETISEELKEIENNLSPNIEHKFLKI